MGIGGSLFHFDRNNNSFTAGIPLEINGIFGRGHSKFEAGIGTNLGLVTRRKYTMTVDDHITDGLNDWHMRKTISSYFYYFMYANIGYRKRTVSCSVPDLLRPLLSAAQEI